MTDDWTPERVEKLRRWMSKLFGSEVTTTILRPGETWPEFYARQVMPDRPSPWAKKTGWRRVS